LFVFFSRGFQRDVLLVECLCILAFLNQNRLLMEDIIKEIQLSVQLQLSYPTLFMSVCLPDICSYAEGIKGKNGYRYMKWLSTYLTNEFDFNYKGTMKPTLTPNDLWKIRNSILHQGESTHKGLDTIKKIEFIPIGAMSRIGRFAVVGEKGIPKEVSIEIKYFSEVMISLTRKWMKSTTKDYSQALSYKEGNVFVRQIVIG